MRKHFIALLTALGAAAAFGLVSDVSTNNFAHCVLIEASGYAGSTSLADFPVLVKVGSGIPGFGRTLFRDPYGMDLSFFDTEDNELASEFDGYDADGSELYWVKLGRLNPVYGEDGPTRFFLCFGSKSDAPIATSQTDPVTTWGSCSGVWHMSEYGGAAHDYTDNGLVAQIGRESCSTDMVSRSDGAIGSFRVNQAGASVAGAYFSVDDFYRIEVPGPYNNNIGLGDAFSFSGWFRAGSIPAGATPRLVSCMARSVDAGGWEAAISGSGSLLVRTGTMQSAVEIPCGLTPADGWTLLNFAFDGARLRVYRNGAELGNGGGYDISPVTTNCLPLAFGCDADGDSWSWGGGFDELRIYSEPSSPDWARAEYDAVANPSFLSYGPVDGKGEAPLFAGDPTVQKGATATDFTFNVTLARGKADIYAVYMDVATGECVSNLVASSAEPQTFGVPVPALSPGHAYMFSAYAVASAEGTDENDAPYTYELVAERFGTDAFSYGEYTPSPEMYAQRIAFVATDYAGTHEGEAVVKVNLGEDVSGFVYADFAYPATGADFLFTDSAGNALPHKVVSWNPSGTSQVRVKLPALAADTVFYAYCCGPAAPSGGGEWDAADCAGPDAFSAAAGPNDPALPVAVPLKPVVGTDSATVGMYIVSLGDGVTSLANAVSYYDPHVLFDPDEVFEGLEPLTAAGRFTYGLAGLSPVSHYGCDFLLGRDGATVSFRFKTSGLPEYSNVVLAPGETGLVASCRIDSRGSGTMSAVRCFIGADPAEMDLVDSVEPLADGTVSVTLPYKRIGSKGADRTWYAAFRCTSAIDEERGSVRSDSPLAECYLPRSALGIGQKMIIR